MGRRWRALAFLLVLAWQACVRGDEDDDDGYSVCTGARLNFVDVSGVASVYVPDGVRLVT